MNENIECLLIESQVNGKVTVFFCVYRPPRGNIEIFLQTMDQILSSLPLHVECVVAGDFNIDLLNTGNGNSSKFLDLMHTFSLIPTITRPTRIFENNGTLIDNIFITRPEGVLSGNLICSLSDHLGNFLIHRVYYLPIT